LHSGVLSAFLLNMVAGSVAVDLGIFSTLRPEIFKGAPSNKPRHSYLPERPQRIRVFKNGVLQMNPYGEEEGEDKGTGDKKQDFKAFWKRIDTDGNDVLTMEEFVGSLQVPLDDGKMQKDDLPEMFNEADEDGSGELTFDEVRKFLFKDQGYDPVVEEAQETSGDDKKFDAFWAQLDSNSDGIMSRAEFETSMKGAVETGHMPVEQMNEMFLRMDTNSDGTVTIDEAKSEIRAQMQLQQQQQSGRGGEM